MREEVREEEEERGEASIILGSFSILRGWFCWWVGGVGLVVVVVHFASRCDVGCECVGEVGDSLLLCPLA